MKIEWNVVTWYSKLLAIIFLLGVFPAWTFYLGTQYENTEEVLSQPISNLPAFIGNTHLPSDTAFNLDPAVYIPGLIFESQYASGEVGKFNSDHTINLKWGRDYAGPNDTRPSGGTGTWNVKGSILTIKGTATIDGSYDFSTLNKDFSEIDADKDPKILLERNVGGKIVVGRWNTDVAMDNQTLVGFFIADSLDTLSQITDVSSARMLFNMK